jgi:hypothetical protein
MEPPPPPPSLEQVLAWVPIASDDEARTAVARILLHHPKASCVRPVTRSQSQTQSGKRQKPEQKVVAPRVQAQVSSLVALPVAIFSLVCSMLSYRDHLVANTLSHDSRTNAGLTELFPRRRVPQAWPKEIKFPRYTDLRHFIEACSTGNLTVMDLSCTRVEWHWLSAIAHLRPFPLRRLDISNSIHLVGEHGLIDLAGTFLSGLETLDINRCWL